MTVSLPLGYYTINELLTEFTRLMSLVTVAILSSNNTSGNRKFTDEGLATYSYSINEKYEVTITATSLNNIKGDKFWGVYAENAQAMKDSLLHTI
jgi:hypothetical protein